MSKLILLVLVVCLAIIPVVHAATYTYNLTEDTADMWMSKDINGNWSAQRNAGWGDSATDGASGLSAILFLATATQEEYDEMHRLGYGFNTSSLPDTATISSVTFGFYANAKYNVLGSQNLSITEFSPATPNNFTATDYDNFGSSTEYSNRVAYADVPTDAYTNFTFNTAGKNAINKTGYTNFMVRMSADIDNSNTTVIWSSGNYTGFKIYDFIEDLAKQPFLEITTLTAPVSNFSVDHTGGISPLLVNFTDTSTNTPTSWLWYDGNTLFNSTQNPQFVVFTTGNHQIRLNASNADSGTNTSVTWINVTDAPASVLPIPIFAANITTGTVPLPVNFTDSSISNILGWNWSFGDGFNSTDSSPIHTYITAGTYTVSLQVVNISGYNTTTKTNYITVSAAPDTTAPRSITGLTNGTVTNNTILWQWTNPTDADFNHTVQYKNNVLYYNSSNTTSAIIWTGLTNNTAYTISTHTVDLSGNMNSTWVNATATTNKLATPPAAPSETSPFGIPVDSSAQMSISLIIVLVIALIGVGIFVIIAALNGGSMDMEVIIGIIIGVVIIIIMAYVISIISGTMSMIKI